MNWKIKAFILKIISKFPYSERVYPFFQLHFGRLSGDPYSRFTIAVDFLKILKKNDLHINEKTLFEIGTGHLPLLPTFFYLAGAKEIFSFDLNRRLSYKLYKIALNKIIEDRDFIILEMSKYVDLHILNDRMNVIEKFKDNPHRFLINAKIHYISPGDASKTGINSNSIDFLFSCTTFEHIPKYNLNEILIEASRILKKKGYSIHLIDPSDHFQHQDLSISKINFLKFSEIEWNSIAGNNFAYCNRLRHSDYCQMFKNNHFSIVDENIHVDPKSLELLKVNFEIDSAFKHYNLVDISTTSFMTLLINNK